MQSNRPQCDTDSQEPTPHMRLRPLPMNCVHWTAGFWGDRFRQAHEVSLPHLWDRLADPDGGHVLQNLRIAAGLEDGEFAGASWADAWMAKWIEAATIFQALTGDEGLRRKVDEAIAVVAQAQAEDGYLASQTVARGEERFQDPHRHELYTMGHMVTAGVLHHRLTGETNFLNVARKIGDYVTELYSGEVPRPMVYFPFNPSIIMALVDLYRETGERRYLDAAQGFVDRRGTAPRQWGEHLQHDWMGGDLCQDRIPLREETEMVGHSVCSTYLYAGATDIVAETGEPALFDALKRIWRSFTRRKMFVNGGACAVPRGVSYRKAAGQHDDLVHEAAGPDYYLPNALSYNETCAQIGVFMWAWRLMAMAPEGEYADVMEQTLYSGILAGMGLDGASWFYRNMLRWHGGEHGPYTEEHKRYTCVRFQPGRQAICCPTNLLRTVAEFHSYLYSVSDDALWLHHYGANRLDAALPNGRAVKLTQETEYPWDGHIRVTLDTVSGAPLAMRMRIPGWAEGVALKVNGSKIDVDLTPGSYAEVCRSWQAGDVIELHLPMRPRLLAAHPLVEELRNQVAVMRGPVLYCLESHDLPEGVPLHEIHLPRDIKLTSRHVPDLLGGVTVLEGTAQRLAQGDWSDRLYKPLSTAAPEPVPLRLIPYYAWANRGVGEMTVWVPVA